MPQILWHGWLAGTASELRSGWTGDDQLRLPQRKLLYEPACNGWNVLQDVHELG
jgi:hypothetical protein